MKKALLIIFGLLFAVNTIYAQKTEKTIGFFVGGGVNEFNNFATGGDITYGVSFIDFFSIGAGIGYKYFNDVASKGNIAKSKRYLLIPVHLRLKMNFGTDELYPFIMCDVGWAYNLWKLKSVVLFEPSFGVSYKKMTFALGAILYPSEYTCTYTTSEAWGYSTGSYTVEGYASVVCVKVGFAF